MRFHGMMLVRDEEDILPECFDHLLQWIDAIYVMDMGSTDTTWDIVQDYAGKDKRIVPVLTQPTIFSEGVRSFIFEKYRDRFRNGDWIVKLDADEFYHIKPQEFVRERLRLGETAVYLAWYYFRLTSKEVLDYESGVVDIAVDRKRPIEQRRRMFKIADYGEPRMFRFRASMRWPETGAAFPFNAGYVARERIPIRHYPHRDPVQMQKRFRIRSLMNALDPRLSGPHWKLEDWRKDVIDFDPATGIARERSSPSEGLSCAQGHTAGHLYEWVPGTALPEIQSTIHLAQPLKRLAQRVVHPLLLPVLDPFRRPFSRDFVPPRIPDHISAQLRLCDALPRSS